jgi:hypothetical protein
MIPFALNCTVKVPFSVVLSAPKSNNPTSGSAGEVGVSSWRIAYLAVIEEPVVA